MCEVLCGLCFGGVDEGNFIDSRGFRVRGVRDFILRF